MSYRKHKLTKDVQKQLKSYSEKLPAMVKYDAAGHPVYKLALIDGAEMINSGAKDLNGKTAVIGQKYKANVLVYEDHFANLCILYKDGGMDAVTGTIAMLETAKRKKERQVYASRPWSVKISDWLYSIFSK